MLRFVAADYESAFLHKNLCEPLLSCCGLFSLGSWNSYLICLFFTLELSYELNARIDGIMDVHCGTKFGRAFGSEIRKTIVALHLRLQLYGQKYTLHPRNGSPERRNPPQAIDLLG